MFADVKALSVGLPEDIQKLKWYGDFEGALRVIGLRLQGELPQMLRQRLELERVVLKSIPRQYPYSQADALKLMKESIKDFDPAELDHLRDENAVDWIYITGQVHYKNNFFSNLLKTRQHYADRLIQPAKLEQTLKERAMLSQAIERMQAQGNLAYRTRMHSAIKVKPEFARIGETIRVHIPLPIEGFQTKNVRVLAASPQPTHVAAPDYPQRTAFFKQVLQPDQEFSVEYEYETHMHYVQPKPEEVSPSQPDMADCLGEQLPHIAFTPYLRALAQEIVGSESNPLVKARLIYDFITTKIRYSFVRSYFTYENIPEYISTSLKGDCGMQALLFITLCRIVGVPARWQAGLYSTPLSVGEHDWAQFYIAPYGWLYADCSFGGGAYRRGDHTLWNFYFGNLDPFRTVCNTAFQHDFDPPKAHLRFDPYDNQDGEVEYEDRGLPLSELEITQTIVSIEPIKAD